MSSVTELLLETLADLSHGDLERFKEALDRIHLCRYYSKISLRLLKTADMQDTMFLMIRIYGQQTLEITKVFLKNMNRIDLAQRLTDKSSGPQSKTIKIKTFKNQKVPHKFPNLCLIFFTL